MTKLEKLQQELSQIDTLRNTILTQIENSKKKIERNGLNEFKHLIGKCYKFHTRLYW